MPRTSNFLLGSTDTPWGRASVRAERSSRGRWLLAFHGPTLALRWLIPGQQIGAEQTRLRVTLQPDISSMEQAQAFYTELDQAWETRRATEAPPSTLPLQRLTAVPMAIDRSASRPESSVTLDQLIAAADHEAGTTVRTSTLHTYRFEWGALCRLLPGSTPIARISRTTVIEILAADQRAGTAKETQRKHAVALKRLLARGVREGHLTINPMEGLRLPKVPRRAPRFLTFAERDRLLSCAERLGRDCHLLIALMVFLGLRKAEALAITWPDLDLARNVAQVVNSEHFTTKNGRDRTIPICRDLAEILSRYRLSAGFVLSPARSCRPGRRYRWDFRGLFERAVREAGLDPTKITPHILRHTFASLNAQAGVSLFKIGQWMGHSTSEVTELYAHLAVFDDDIERLNRTQAP